MREMARSGFTLRCRNGEIPSIPTLPSDRLRQPQPDELSDHNRNVELSEHATSSHDSDKATVPLGVMSAVAEARKRRDTEVTEVKAPQMPVNRAALRSRPQRERSRAEAR